MEPTGQCPAPKTMTMNKKTFLLISGSILSLGVIQAQHLNLSVILDSIQAGNPSMRMYEAEIQSMDAAARGARSWMPPELGAGFFMTPYNTSKWKAKEDAMGTMQDGMGSFMISAQQMIASKRKLNAEEAYMRSMSSVAKEQRKVALNDLYARAKQAYYDMVIIQRKKAVLEENEKILEFMIKNAEIRYKHGLEKLSAYYKAKAALGNVQNMRLILDNEFKQRTITLNTLMNRSKEAVFTIDTAITVKDYSSLVIDSVLLVQSRSDIRALDRDITVNLLRQESERMNLRPQFGVRFEHMFGFGQPMQFTLMGMVRIPFAPWSARMSRANIESLNWRSEAMNNQRQMIINEAAGMATGMRTELETKRRQVRLYENNIIPALRNNYKALQLGYEQNTEELFMLFDAWESLSMMQSEYLDQLQQLLTLQLQLERLLEIK
jgi:outer membrane protein TolC